MENTQPLNSGEGTEALQYRKSNTEYNPNWYLVAAVLLRGDTEPEFKQTRLYKKALWLATDTKLSFEKFAHE
jgi:hypothetical protein